nr:probable minipolypeptide - mouse [Mus musculus]
MRSPGGRTC